jgi:hypothetical protein
MEGVQEKEYIPNEDHVFRNIRYSSWSKKPNKRRPIEADFILDDGEDGLSVNWDKYCDLEKCFILIGLIRTQRGFLPIGDWKVIRFNVGALRGIALSDEKKVEDVVYDPKPKNNSHSLVLYENDEEIRVKLCEIVERDYDKMVHKCPDYNKVQEKLETLRENPDNIEDVTRATS